MSSHYRQIDGKKYSAALLDAADEMVAGQGDGRVGLEDAEKLLGLLKNDGKYSDLEKTTLSYIRQNCNWTEQADAFLQTEIQSWTAPQPASSSQAEGVKGRSLSGKVVSNKPVGGKTVTVEVERRVLHSKYKKIVKRRSKYRAHDEENICQINDEVVIQESRPLSKTKRWVVVKHTSAQH